MPLFPTHLPVVSFLLHASHGQANSLIDIFPHRITPQPGHTLDDAILTILGQAYNPAVKEWNVYRLTGCWVTRHGHGTGTYTHPVAICHPGGVHIEAGKEDLSGMAHTISAHVLPEGVQILDRIYPHGLFARPGRDPRHIHQWNMEMAGLRADHPALLDLALGFVDAAAAHRMPYLDVAPATTALLARAARLVQTQKGGAKTGKAALAQGHDIGKRLMEILRHSWRIRPNAIAAPTHHTLDPQWASEIQDLRTSPLFLAGQRIQNEQDIPASTLALLVGAQPSSQHDTLALRAGEKRLDAAIARHIPQEWLRPAGRTIARALR